MRERTEDECRIIWTNTLYPGINTGKWETKEDKALLDMVRVENLASLKHWLPLLGAT